MEHNYRTMTCAVFVALGFLVSACSAAGSPEPLTVTPSAPPERPSDTPTATAEPSPTLTPTVVLWPTPRSRDMEDYGLSYDPEATPRLPPGPSVSMPIWEAALPARPIEGEPRLISSQPPAPIADRAALLEGAGCRVDEWGQVTCPADGPLAAFGCESIDVPTGQYPELGPGQGIVGTCYTDPPVEDQPRDAYLFRRGCAFRSNAAHILKVGDQYVLVSTAGALQELLAPIESPEEALLYAQLMTGLVARFAFEYDPTLLYFQDPIEGTQVTGTNGGYSLNLFHFVGCLCEPFVHSEVEIAVDRAGGVTWVGAIPIAMTTGFSCAD